MFPDGPPIPQVYRRIFLTRGEVAISKLMPVDAIWLEQWVNDPVTTRWMSTGRIQMIPETVFQQIAHWQEPRDWPFVVLLSDPAANAGFKEIGTVGLYDTDLLTRKAEFRILLAAPYLGRGYGTEATKLALEFGFQRLGLQRIYLGVTDANIGAIRCYEKCGFLREGILRRDLYRDGQFYDSIRMAILDEDYRKRSEPCPTDEAKPAAILEPGPDIPQPVAEPLTGFSGGAGRFPLIGRIPPLQ